MEMGIIKAGTTLWHGTGAERGFVVPDGPAWFSDSRAVAWHFAWLHVGMFGPTFPARVLKFETTRDLELPVVENKQTVKKPAGRESRPWTEDETWTKDPWQQFVRSFRLGGENDDVESFAHRVCRHYDGWWVVDNYMPGDDIMLCDPSRCVRRVRGTFWQKGQR